MSIYQQQNYCSSIALVVTRVLIKKIVIYDALATRIYIPREVLHQNENKPQKFVKRFSR